MIDANFAEIEPWHCPHRAIVADEMHACVLHRRHGKCRQIASPEGDRSDVERGSKK